MTSVSRNISSSLEDLPDQGVSVPLALIISAVGIYLLILFCGVFGCCSALRKPDLSTLKSRLDRLEEILPSTEFLKWYKADQINHPHEWHVDRESQVCVICLDTIKANDSIRALSCRHIYHGQCFDRWFTEFHEYCPLCHCLVLVAADNAV